MYVTFVVSVSQRATAEGESPPEGNVTTVNDCFMVQRYTII